MLAVNKQMKDERLKMVCGGDNGDEQKDTNSAQSWYQVGQYVEVYSSFFHVTTKRRKIRDKRFVNGHWEYKFIVTEVTTDNFETLYAQDTEMWCSADEIER